MKKVTSLILALLLLGAAACANAPEATALVVSANAAETAAPSAPVLVEATPVPVLATALGDIAIASARFVDEVHGDRPQAGEKLLLVVLAQPDLQSLTPDQVSLEALDQTVHAAGQDGVYILGSDGSRTISTMGGWVDTDLVLGFRIPEAAEVYTLYWPGNAPVVIFPAD